MTAEFSERIESTEDFEEKKTEFFVKTGLKVLEAFKMHKEVGLWGEGKDNWRNVSEHCLAEVARASVWADELHFSQEMKNKIMVAAALHDLFKKNEILRANPTGLTWEEMEASAEDETKFFKTKGVDPEIIKIADSVALVSLKDIEKILEKKNLSDLDIACLVLHYIDDYSSGSDWAKRGALDERLDKAEKNPKYQTLKISGKDRFDGKASYEAQRSIGHEVEKRLQNILTERSGENILAEDMPKFFDQKIIDIINSGNY